MDRKQRDLGNFNVQDAAGLRMPIEQLCVSCHKASEQAYHHAPALLGDCSRCHHPHLSRHEHLLLQPRARDLCVTCHDAATMVTDALHAGFGDRDCTSCHDPHASDTRAFLKPGWDSSGPVAPPQTLPPAAGAARAGS